ncbi:hypothetical protein ABXS75_04165 [Roseburia hominis]
MKKIITSRNLSILILTLLVITIACSGCKKNEKTNEKSPEEISEGAQAIIKACMTVPNPDLYDREPHLTIGLGTEVPSEEEKEEVRKATEARTAAWEKAVGKYFSPNSLNYFLSTTGYYYLDTYYGQTVEVTDMELVEKDDDYEIVKVTISIEETEQEEKLKFRKNADGSIWQVNIWSVEHDCYI